MSAHDLLVNQLAADDVVGSMRFHAMTPEDRAAQLETAVTAINERHAPVPVTAEQIHVHPAIMSTDALDSYFSRMHASSLQNFAKQATEGRAFMNMHRTGGFARAGELPLGHTYTGAYSDDGDRRRAAAGIYMLKGSTLTGTSTDELSRAIDAGTLRDVSVGFSGGKSICEVCGNDVRDYDKCPHIPGTNYKCSEGVTATYNVQDAQLRELSAVYEGATPGAMFSRACLDKTERSIIDNIIGAREINFLEEHYRMPLTTSRKLISIPGKVPVGERTDGTMKTKAFVDNLIVRSAAHMPDTFRKSLEDIRTKAGDDDTDLAPVMEAFGRAFQDAGKDSETLKQFTAAGVPDVSTARSLKAAADDGKEYRTDLIADAIAQGIRAMEGDFPKEMYEKMLAEPSRSITEIKTLRDAWQKQGNQRLAGMGEDGKPSGSGGRQTTPLHGFEAAAGGTEPKAVGNTNNFRTTRPGR